MKAPVNTKTRKPENAKTEGINLWTRKRRKRENGKNAKTAKTRKPRKRGKRENGRNTKRRKPENAKTAKTDESPKTAKSVPVFWFSISRFLVFSVFSVFWFSRFLVFSFRWPHPSGQVAFFMCLALVTGILKFIYIYKPKKAKAYTEVYIYNLNIYIYTLQFNLYILLFDLLNYLFESISSGTHSPQMDASHPSF